MESNNITLAAQLTLEYQQQMKELLDNPLYNGIYMTANNTINGLLNRLNHLSGQRPRTQEVVQFPPITSFMGEELTLPRDLSKEDLEPKEHEKQTFIQRVNNLEIELRSMSMYSIMNSYTLPEDQLVLRGVAKRANVDDFAERVINEKFVEDIIKGLDEKDKNAGIEAEIQKQLSATVGVSDANQVSNNIGLRNAEVYRLQESGLSYDEILLAMAEWDKNNVGKYRESAYDESEFTGPTAREAEIERLVEKGLGYEEMVEAIQKWDELNNIPSSFPGDEKYYPKVGDKSTVLGDLVENIQNGSANAGFDLELKLDGPLDPALNPENFKEPAVEPPVHKTFKDIKDLVDSVPEEIKNKEFTPAKGKPGPKPKQS